MHALRGKTIAITEARRGSELAALVRKLGGVPYPAPAVREIPRRDRGPALAALERICRGEVAMIIFLTGVGTRAFFALAQEAERGEALRRSLQSMLVVARGPKPVAALREADRRPDVVPEEPTSEGVLAALATRDLRGALVAVQLYGDENPALAEGLAARGAIVLEIPLYEWTLPEDQEPLVRLVHDLTDGRIDVIAFTSSPQIRHLFVVADRLGKGDAVARALQERVLVAAIGPVSAATLREHGITPRVQPARGTMGALVHGLAEHLGRG